MELLTLTTLERRFTRGHLVKTLVIGAMLLLPSLTAQAQFAYPSHPSAGAGIYFSPGYVAMRRQAMRNGVRHTGRHGRRGSSRRRHRRATRR